MEFLLKSALISAVLYSFYKVFLQKETFFNSNRIYFLIGIVISIVLPLLIIPIYIEASPIIVSELLSIPMQIDGIVVNTDVATISSLSINWVKLIFSLYLIGVVFLSIKFIVDLFSLLKLLFYGDKIKSGNIIFVKTTKELSPFSFFNFIVYNKNQFKKEELIDIITHEKVHVNQKHSFDILLVQFLTILQWFNPFVWLYKKDLQQNLEYIADQVAQEYAKTQKEYQYLLLKTSIPNYSFALSNNFFNSHLKKRIMMLQKSKTNRMNQAKYLLLIPLIALFLLAFNTKEVVIPIANNIISESSNKINNQDPTFINPIHKVNVVRISSKFGRRIHPVSKEIRQHNGIDIIAHKGIDVYATADGKVVKSQYNDLKGNYIQIAHANNYQTNYYHLGSRQVEVDELLKAGDIIGIVGNSGQSIGTHLHYEVVKNGKQINPISFVKYDTIKKERAVFGTKSTTKKYSVIANEFDIKRTITSKSSKKHLKRIKKEFKNKFEVDLKFYDVKRNKNKEIVAIKIDGNTLNTESSFSYSQDTPIGDILLAYNKEQDEIYIENIGKKVMRVTNKINHKTSSYQFSSSNAATNNANSGHPVSIVTTIHESYTVNGKEVSKDEMNKIDPATIDVRKYTDEVSGDEAKEMKMVFKDDIEQKTGWVYYNGKAYYYTSKNGKYTFLDRYGSPVRKDIKKELLAIALKKEIDQKKILNDSVEKKSIKSDYRIDKNNPTGSIQYQGETYYYSRMKPVNFGCSADGRKGTESKMSKKTISKVKIIKHNGNTMFKYENAVLITFYDKYGADVTPELSRILRNKLDGI